MPRGTRLSFPLASIPPIGSCAVGTASKFPLSLWRLGQNSGRTKVPRIFANFCPEFSRILLRIFPNLSREFSFPRKRRPEKFTKIPLPSPMQNSQANTKENHKQFRRGGKVIEAKHRKQPYRHFITLTTLTRLFSTSILRLFTKIAIGAKIITSHNFIVSNSLSDYVIIVDFTDLVSNLSSVM